MDDASEEDRRCLYDSARELLQKTALLIVGLNLEDPGILMKEIRSTILQYCKYDNEWNLGKQILLQCQKEISNTENSEILSFEEMYSKFRMKLEKKKEENLEEHPWYREFKKIELDLSKNTDKDVVNTQEKKNYLDPYTKQIMQDPMINVKCGHSYDRVAVLSMLKRKNSLRCPYSFCGARVVEQNLKENVELLNEIRESQNN